MRFKVPLSCEINTVSILHKLYIPGDPDVVIVGVVKAMHCLQNNNIINEMATVSVIYPSFFLVRTSVRF